MFGIREISLDEAHTLPRWRRPEMLLYVMATAMPISFATWSALLNNFVIDVVHFDGIDIGWLQSFREVPGFLAIGVIVVLWVMREQVLAIVSLLLLGAATAVTALFPSFGGLIVVTLLSSIGFHYFQAVNQSLQLQWIDKAKAPQTLARIVAIGSAASLLAYGLLVLTWKTFALSYEFVYAAAGLTTVAIMLAAALLYPQFRTREPQSKKFVLRRRYWLYYAITFMAGARRQIFVVFAAFMMVERFGLRVDEITLLFMVNFAINIAAAPAMGRLVARFGERRALICEYCGLTALFVAYGGIYWFGWGLWLACALYVVDHLLFALAFAQKTYFQKICDPGDIAPTAAVSFTINHIAAVFLPVTLGYLWMISPGTVFGLAAMMALVSLGLALLVPRHPSKGYETVLQGLGPLPA
ncbi:MFS transporter [Thioclava sp. BHET1]|nr:MFS transporter [Thioclava sp. BHET1]